MLIHGRMRRETTAIRPGEYAPGTVPQPVASQQCRTLGFHRILLVVDDASGLASALRAARMLLERSAGEILIVEAGDSGAAAVPRTVQQAIWENGIEEVDTREISRPTISAGSIEAIVRRYDCDLAILTMQAQSAGERLVAGGIGEETFRRVPCPVLAIGPNVKVIPSPGVTGCPVICATSFHRGNTRSIALAAGIAAFCCAPLECVHVLPGDMAGETRGRHVVPEIMRNALIADAKSNGVRLKAEQCHILFAKSVSMAITAYAAERAAQFIVLGIRHGGPFAADLPSGITSSIVASASCPVLMIAGQE